MNQPLISQFFFNQRNPPLKRKYEDIVNQLIREAEQKLEAKENSVQKKKQLQLLETKEIVTPKRSYKKYRYEQKEALIKLAPYMSYAQIETKFGVDEATFRGWIKNGVHEDQRKQNGKTSVYKKVEELLYEVLTKKRENGTAVTANVIYKEVKVLIMDQYNLGFKEYQMLQNYAKYCRQSGYKDDKILYMKSDEELKSFDNKGDEIKLNFQELIELRDAFLKQSRK